MRYYADHDKIFIFGFSRGAFTARFLARMVCAIGVLSKGNEEMVPFAYKRYQDSLTKTGQYKGWSDTAIEKDIAAFKETFCRKHVFPYFLGVFDTVNSIGVFKLPAMNKLLPDEQQYDSVAKTARYIRHAVSIDERRCKFRPALLCPGAVRPDEADGPDEEIPAREASKPNNSPQENGNIKSQHPHQKRHRPVRIREVYFAGSHADIGGGFAAAPNLTLEDEVDDPVLLSDVAMNWMLEELDAINAGADDEIEILAFNDNKEIFQRQFRRKQIEAVVSSRLHDTLTWRDGGCLTVFWQFLGMNSRSSALCSHLISVNLHFSGLQSDCMLWST